MQMYAIAGDAKKQRNHHLETIEPGTFTLLKQLLDLAAFRKIQNRSCENSKLKPVKFKIEVVKIQNWCKFDV